MGSVSAAKKSLVARGVAMGEPREASTRGKKESLPMVTATRTKTQNMAKKTIDRTKVLAGEPGAKQEPDAKQEKGSKSLMASFLEGNATLKNTVAQIEKQFGEGAIMSLGGDKCVSVEGIPTGSLSLDLALGGQGIPRGRVVEIFGPESSGKTTLALHVVAQAQNGVGSPPLSTPNMPWTQPGPRNWAWSWKPCW